MSHDPDPVSDATLDAWAAGELPEAQASALRRRAESDPALAARLQRAERFAAWLGSDELLPAPVTLLGQVLRRVAAEAPPRAAVDDDAAPSRRGRPARAVAALLLAAIGGWTAIGGWGPVAAVADAVARSPLPAAVAERLPAFPVPPTPGAVWDPVPWTGSLRQAASGATSLAHLPGGAPVAGLAGLFALLVGVGLARRPRPARRACAARPD